MNTTLEHVFEVVSDALNRALEEWIEDNYAK